MKDISRQIDDLVRQRLDDLPPPSAPAGSWANLERRLDEPTDAPLRDALSGLASPAVVGWEALERRLDPQTAADAAIADKLNSLAPAPAPGAWASFATLLDARTQTAVDEIVSQQLHQVGTGPTTGWAALAARLELIRDRRSRVAAVKITELAIMASVFLLFLRFGFLVASPPVPAPPPATGPVAAQTNPANHQAAPAPNPTLPETNVTLGHTEVASVRPGSTNLNLPVAPPDPVPRTPSSERRSSLTELPANYLTQVSSIKASGDELTSRLSVLGTSADVPPATALLEVKPAYFGPGLRVPLRDINVPGTQVYLNTFVSPFDVNQVITNYLQVLDLDISADNRLTQGSSAGLLVDLVKGKSGVQFGMIYSEVSYIPSVLKWFLQEEFPIFEPLEGYSRFHFERLELPFSLTRTLHEANKWRWSAHATASISVVARSSFEIENESRIQNINERLLTNLPDLPDNGSGARSPSNNRETIQDLVDPSPGWFDGGSFFDNSAFYLGGGFTVERLLSPRASIYLNPSFNRVVYLNPDDEEAGQGPYQDRLHTTRFRFGARYLINRH